MNRETDVTDMTDPQDTDADTDNEGVDGELDDLIAQADDLLDDEN